MTGDDCQKDTFQPRWTKSEAIDAVEKAATVSIDHSLRDGLRRLSFDQLANLIICFRAARARATILAKLELKEAAQRDKS